MSNLKTTIAFSDYAITPLIPNVADIPLSLYIHIPWCVKKCPYCDFNSHQLSDIQTKTSTSTNSTSTNSTGSTKNPSTGSNNSDNDGITDTYFDDYVTALIDDINNQLPLVQQRPIYSIFIGGGTPSLLPIAQYQRLFTHLRSVLTFADDIEVTMEANPGTLEHAPFEDYLAVGINRLSIGVQSFADDKLQALGRIHDGKQAQTAIAAARRAGFKRLNVDLMHGLPKQSMHEAMQDITLAHRAGATHISWYQLTIEPNTVFYRDTPILPDDDNLADIEAAGTNLFNSLGYRNYEVSAWVGPNDGPSRHNVNYWQFGDYLAIGAGAHGKVTVNRVDTDRFSVNSPVSYTSDTKDVAPKMSSSPETSWSSLPQGVYRFSKTRLPKDYMNYKAEAHEKVDSKISPIQKIAGVQKADKAYPKTVNIKAIDNQEMAGEFMLNVLRLNEGIDATLFASRTGHSLDSISANLQALRTRGLLVDDETIIAPTPLGRRYLNQVLQTFL